MLIEFLALIMLVAAFKNIIPILQVRTLRIDQQRDLGAGTMKGKMKKIPRLLYLPTTL